MLLSEGDRGHYASATLCRLGMFRLGKKQKATARQCLKIRMSSR